MMKALLTTVLCVLWVMGAISACMAMFALHDATFGLVACAAMVLLFATPSIVYGKL